MSKRLQKKHANVVPIVQKPVIAEIKNSLEKYVAYAQKKLAMETYGQKWEDLNSEQQRALIGLAICLEDVQNIKGV